MGLAQLYTVVWETAFSRIGAWGAGNTLRPAFYLPRCHYSTPFERQAQGVFAIKWGCACRDRVARHGRGVGGYRVPGIRRGQRLVPLHAIPRRWAGKPWDAGPVGIASLVCPAGHGTGVIICRGLSLLLRPFAGLAGAFIFALESKQILFRIDMELIQWYNRIKERSVPYDRYWKAYQRSAGSTPFITG